MKRVDAHQHFWKFNPVRESWITDNMSLIKRDFLPEDLQPILQQNGFDGCVLVQSAQPEEENQFLLELAAAHDFVKGVVGWVDLLAPDVEARLEQYTSHPKLKGFRYGLQSDPDRAVMLHPAFRNGISMLQQFNYTYDLLILPDQLSYTRALVAAYPDQLFVIDHLAKPNIKAQELDSWKKDMQALSQHENVYCKISGMVTEADWYNWQKKDFIPYLDTVTAAFGTERIMFGSDWPVCTVAGAYEQTLHIVQDYFCSFSEAEQEAFFGGNTSRFYNLP